MLKAVLGRTVSAPRRGPIPYRLCAMCNSSTGSQGVGKKVIDIYKQRVVLNEIVYDEKQFAVAKLLDRLRRAIALTAEQSRSIAVSNESRSPTDTKRSPEGTNSMAAESGIQTGTATVVSGKRVRGVYIYGEVGTGKTMLMDIFYSSLIDCTKLRVHFNDFMLDVHSRIHRHRQYVIQKYGRNIHIDLTENSSERDSIIFVAHELGKEFRVLCFDEFQVTDICDAMILSRLFNELWKCGVILVATSNRPPIDLYKNGLNRKYFLPFIESLQRECVAVDIDVDKDYRQENSDRKSEVYLIPNDGNNNNILWEKFNNEIVQHNGSIQSETIPVMMGRTLTLRNANRVLGACFVEFSEICETEIGAADYQALCHEFHTIYMINVPILSVLKHNEARRFIMFIDSMYNAKTRFIWTAEGHPWELFRILTTEEMKGDLNSSVTVTPLGSDHQWKDTDTVTSSSSSSPSPSPSLSSPNRTAPGAAMKDEPISASEHLLRGAQQRVMDSNMYFGSTYKITNTKPNSSSELSEEDSHNGSSPTEYTTEPTDAAQELQVLEGELASVQELDFAFRRAASRLVEMSSKYYETTRI